MVGALVFRPPARLVQAAFFAALVVACVAATWPQPVMPEAGNNDKFLHFTTFYVLELLALAAFRTRLLIPAIGLLVIGGLIEIVQGMVGRDRSLWDLVADGLGILCALAPLAAAAMRRAD